MIIVFYFINSLPEMMEEDQDNQNHPLLQPFLSSSSTTSVGAATVVEVSTPFSALASSSSHERVNSSSSSDGSCRIILRVAMILSIGIVSIWANHEASKGFSISVVNEAPRGRPPWKLFDLFYVSDDGASRLLLNASKFVEDFLYPNPSYPKKQVSGVILRLPTRNLSQPVIVESGEVNDQFTIRISPSILEEIDFKHAMFVAMQHGMVRLWLWDGLGNAPSDLVNGIVEYVGELAISGAGTGGMPGFGGGDGHCCWKSMKKDPKGVATFLNYWEMKKPGFIRRLNRGMRNGWHDRMVDDALGVHVQHQCDAHN